MSEIAMEIPEGVIASENPKPKEEIEKELNPVCKEVLSYVEENGIPLSFEMKRLLELKDDGRYGGAIALATGELMRNLALYGTGSQEVNESIFGINTYESWDDILDYIKDGDPTLNDDETRRLAEMEIAEVMSNPREFYGLTPLNESVDTSPMATRIIGLLRQATYQETPPEGTPIFDAVSDRKTRFANCKDSEFYLSKTLPESAGRREGARTIVYCDESGRAVLYQKAGDYHIDTRSNSNAHFESATAISLCEICVNGVMLPPGTLVGLDTIHGMNYRKFMDDTVMGIDQITGVLPLRATMYTDEPIDPVTTFGQHYTDFLENISAHREYGLGEEVPTLETFRDYARQVVDNSGKFPANLQD